MRAVVVIELDLDEDAPYDPWPEALKGLREAFPDTEHAKAIGLHIGVKDAAERVMGVFSTTAQR